MTGLRRFALRVFGRLPKPVRRLIVRTLSPTWTAGVVAVIERDDGRWLLVSPVYRPGWSLPGGLLNRGEDAASAVRREFREELGVGIELQGEPWIVHDSSMRRIDVIFRAEIVDGPPLDEIEVQTAELDGVGWFDPAELPVVEQEAIDVVAALRKSSDGGTRILMR